MGLLTYNQKHDFDQTDWLVQSAQLAQTAELVRPVPDAMNLRALMKPMDSALQSSTVYPANTIIPTQFYLPRTDQLHEHAHLTY